MAGGRDAPSAGEARHRANRAGPAAGWTWRDARRTLQFGKKEGATSIVLLRNGEARFAFPTSHKSAFSHEKVAGQRSAGPKQQQQQCANRAPPKQQLTTDVQMESETLNQNHKQQKSADRLQKYNLEMAAILELKLRHFVLRALKRVRHDRVWRIAGPTLAARAANAVHPPALMREGVQQQVAGDKESAGAKRASRPSPTILGSPASSTPSKSRPRTGTSTAQGPAGDGPSSPLGNTDCPWTHPQGAGAPT